jgi:hypothetical protein
MATHFVDPGKQWVADVIDGATRAAKTDMKYVAWGTGTVSGFDETRTTLYTEASEARTTGVMSQVTTTITGDTYQVVGTITANGTKTITNAGLFDQSAVGGNALIIGDFTGVPLLLGDSIEFTFKLHVDQ